MANQKRTIRVPQNLLMQRELLHLAHATGEDKYTLVGRLIALWSWALDNAPDGVLWKHDAEVIPEVTGDGL